MLHLKNVDILGLDFDGDADLGLDIVDVNEPTLSDCRCTMLASDGRQGGIDGMADFMRCGCSLDEGEGGQDDEKGGDLHVCSNFFLSRVFVRGLGLEYLVLSDVVNATRGCECKCWKEKNKRKGCPTWHSIYGRNESKLQGVMAMVQGIC